MNVIQMMKRIDRSLDRVNSPRFDNLDYIDALNKASQKLVNDRVAPLKEPKSYSFERSQRLIDELYTLVETTSPLAPTLDRFAIPSFVNYVLLVEYTINGIVGYSKPITHAELANILRNPFGAPSVGVSKKSNKVRHITDLDGVKLYYGTGTFTEGKLTYVRNPEKVSIGRPTDIKDSSSTLSIGTQYIVLNEAVVGGNKYFDGEIFTAGSTSITEGEVIPTSVIVNSNMPERIHDEIVNLAASIMTGNVDDYNKRQLLEQEAIKS